MPSRQGVASLRKAAEIPHSPRRGKWFPATLTRPADWQKIVPLTAVALAVAYNLWTLRAELTTVQNLNDGAVHISMIEWARQRIALGDSPFDGWFPYLQLGFPQFHHYQSFPHIISGFLALAMGAIRAYTLTLYLLLALWPVCVFWSTRLLGWGRWQAGLSALVSPLMLSIPGYGYEYGSYTWQGLGVWTQLWGMWLLPLSWGFVYRALSGHGSLVPAVATTGAAVVCHFLTGYLALLSLGALVLIKPSAWKERLRAAAIVGGGSLLVSAWVLVPLVSDAKWAGRTEFGRNISASHGAARVLGWLFGGGLFDGARLPVITILVAVGVALCVVRFRTEERARAVLVLAVLSLVLFFGRSALGPLVRLLPGSDFLIFRRYIFGVHLAGALLAGIGAAGIASLAVQWARSRRPSLQTAAVSMLALLIALLMLLPAFTERASYHARGRRFIDRQQAAEARDGAHLDSVVAELNRQPPGRVYAGTIWGNNWGDRYRVGYVPVYAWLLQSNVDSVGFTLRTLSLSSDVEVRFDEKNLAHYDLFNVRYLLMPPGKRPDVPATPIFRRGRHTLYRVRTSGYITVGDALGPPLKVERGNVGRAVDRWLRSDLPERRLFRTVAFGDEPSGPATVRTPGTGPPPGRVTAQKADPESGRFSAVVSADRPVLAVLKSTFHGRWRAEVDHRPVPHRMVSPSFVGVPVAQGRHEVTFQYVPFPYHPPLLLLAGLAVAGLHYGPRILKRSRRLEKKPRETSGIPGSRDGSNRR